MTRMTLLAASVLFAGAFGCVTDDEMIDEAGLDDGSEEEFGEEESELATYTPFTGTSTTGPASLYPWKGYRTTYPNGTEDMRGYALPSTVECSSSKSTRTHLDVTAGCLKAIAIGNYSRGQIQSTSDGAFRVVAKAFTSPETNPLKWTDQRNEYRFYYTKTSGAGVDPGFKAFVRYRTENDLYVASWRIDGKVNIKKKQAGTYKTLVERTMSKPSTGTWHSIRFDAIGSRLDLYLDGTKVLSTTDSSFSWGTAGIRTDAMTGAYLDEWTVR
jgi:hypothetical protein